MHASKVATLWLWILMFRWPIIKWTHEYVEKVHQVIHEGKMA